MDLSEMVISLFLKRFAVAVDVHVEYAIALIAIATLFRTTLALKYSVWSPSGPPSCINLGGGYPL